MQASAGLQMQGGGGGAGVTVRLGFMGFEGFRACIKAGRFKLRRLARPVATKQGDSLACCKVYTLSSEP